MKLSKLAKIAVPVSIAGLVLAGCGSKPVHHHVHHRETQTYTMHHQSKPKRRVSHTKKMAKNSYQNIPAVKPRVNHAQQNAASRRVAKPVTPTPAKPVYHPTDPMHADLDYGITGNVDRGAGQIYVTFNIGHWQITSHGNDVDENADTAVNNARTIASWAQSHTLPYPSDIGTIHIESDGTATASWDGHTARGPLTQVLAYIASHQNY